MIFSFSYTERNDFVIGINQEKANMIFVKKENEMRHRNACTTQLRN